MFMPIVHNCRNPISKLLLSSICKWQEIWHRALDYVALPTIAAQAKLAIKKQAVLNAIIHALCRRFEIRGQTSLSLIFVSWSGLLINGH